jgi:predicted Zn-ribbon and HTH transcriptional regulator
MPFALIPDGFTLKKVTKLQQQAINSKRRHDNVMAILENSQTPLVVAGIVTAFLAGRAADSLIDDIKATGESLTEKGEQAIRDSLAVAEKELVTDPANWFTNQLGKLQNVDLSALEKLDIRKLA